MKISKKLEKNYKKKPCESQGFFLYYFVFINFTKNQMMQTTYDPFVL